MSLSILTEQVALDLVLEAFATLAMTQAGYEARDFAMFLTERNISNIVELGTGAGGMMWLMDRVCQPGLRVSMDMPWESRDPNMPTYWEDKFRAQLPHVIQIFGDIHASQQLERLKSVLDGRSIDLLFIDADHSYEGGLKHWYMYRHLVRSRGLVAFHDVRNGWPVGKFYDELCLSHEHREFCESVNPYGIGVITLP